MLYLLQLYKMIDNKELFIAVFNDLDFELNELGYSECPSDLISDLLFDNFGVTFECEKQLNRLTETILNYQGRLDALENFS